MKFRMLLIAALCMISSQPVQASNNGWIDVKEWPITPGGWVDVKEWSVNRDNFASVISNDERFKVEIHYEGDRKVLFLFHELNNKCYTKYSEKILKVDEKYVRFFTYNDKYSCIFRVKSAAGHNYIKKILQSQPQITFDGSNISTKGVNEAVEEMMDRIDNAL